MAENYATDRVLLGPCTVSFPNLFKVAEQSQKYEVDLVFVKGSKTHKTLVSLETQAKKARWGTKIPRIDANRVLIKDGDEKINKETNQPLEGYGGKLFVKARSARLPQVTDVNNQPIDDPGEIKGGDTCVALAHVWPYDNSFGRGLSLTLHGVRKLKDGEALGAAPVNAADEMSSFSPDVEEMEF